MPQRGMLPVESRRGPERGSPARQPPLYCAQCAPRAPFSSNCLSRSPSCRRYRPSLFSTAPGGFRSRGASRTFEAMSLMTSTIADLPPHVASRTTGCLSRSCPARSAAGPLLGDLPPRTPRQGPAREPARTSSQRSYSTAERRLANTQKRSAAPPPRHRRPGPLGMEPLWNVMKKGLLVGDTLR
jgi:hypothetical protein